ncbi:hypothetical protein P7E02_15950 [Enterococcus hulanensis]|uniref:hypothetical protein n=1 Tax=Enterococcus hulanensis TaxID=2559929 RepID=UPI00288DC343|nr:hypothetical protein [Enterococcus hulanensis]MDT2661369.1 hypothetical protein [Enterococcus hulanensis]
MTSQKLNQRQIFGMKKENLAKKINQYYSETRDLASVLEYIVAILVRNALVTSDFSLFMNELVRELYLSAEPNEVLRRMSPYFQDYFTKREWDTVIKRLFKSKTNYFQNTKTARENQKHLTKPNTKKAPLDDREVAIESVFQDANGKNHKWTLRDADPLKEKKDFEPILAILTTLSIFENNGVRRFVQLVGSKRIFSEIEVIVEKKAKAKKAKSEKGVSKKNATKKIPTKKEQPQSAQKSPADSMNKQDRQMKRTTLPADFDPYSLSEEELVKLVESTILADAVLKEFHFEYTDLKTGEVSQLPIGAQSDLDVGENSPDQNLTQRLSVNTPEKAAVAVSAKVGLATRTEPEKSPMNNTAEDQPLENQSNSTLRNLLRRFRQK